VGVPVEHWRRLHGAYLERRLAREAARPDVI
jgi:hypothetical protein